MENPHKEHRDRMRKEFLSRGFDQDTPKHKILEMLLFYCIPRKDTNILAHKLLDRFGSFSAIFEAEENELKKIDGIGESAAAFLKLMLPVIRTYSTEKHKRPDRVRSMDEIGDMFMDKYIGIKNERFSMASFNSKGEVCGFDFLSSGDIASVGITSRMVVETALKRNAVGIVLCHNHPGGIATPSNADLNITKTINDVLKQINIRLIDHLILSDDDYVSLRLSVKYAEYLD